MLSQLPPTPPLSKLCHQNLIPPAALDASQSHTHYTTIHLSLSSPLHPQPGVDGTPFEQQCAFTFPHT